MKAYIILLVFVLSGSTIFFSCELGECASKSSYLQTFENFIRDIEKNSTEFTERDWNRAEEKYKKLTGECYDKFHSELTIKEEGKIMKHSLKYAFYKLNNELSLGLTEEKIDNLQFEMENLFDSGKGFKDSLDIYLNSEEFKDAMNEFSKGLDQLGKGIDKFSTELKQLLEDSNISNQ